MRARAWIGIVAVASLPIAGGSGAPATAQSCPQLSGVCSATIVGDTSSASNANSGSCGGSGAPEALFFYSAPRMQVIAWTGSDADQGEVFYLVQYSSDGGQTWETLASNVTATFLPVDPALLPGSDQALVRVLASDGVNTGEDQSDAPFHVAPKDPRVFISGVNDDAVVEPGSVFTLLANYIDPDGQRVDESAFLWRSDRGDILGRGLRLELAANQLRPGPQRISLARIPATHPPATCVGDTSL